MASEPQNPLLARALLTPQSAEMPKEAKKRRPGELFLDRYMANASEEAREEALANLEGLIAILIEIDERIAQEKRDSRKSEIQV